MRPISAALAGLQLQQPQHQPLQQQQQQQQVQRPMSVLQSPVGGRGFAASSAAQYAECLQTLLGLCSQLDRCAAGGQLVAGDCLASEPH